ncbi:MAG: DUF6714 family protein [Planctomycetota bacterium]
MSGSAFLDAEQIAERSEQLLAQVASAFAGVTLGRGVSIEDADAYEDPNWPSYDERSKRLDDAEYMQQFNDWQSLNLRWKGVSVSTYCGFLSPESFRYYVPFFLTCWLRAGLPDFRDEIKTGWDELDERLYWFFTSYDLEKYFEWHRTQISILSRRQKRCIAEFFALMLEAGMMPGNNGSKDWPVVMRFWGKYLDAKDLKRVKHEYLARLD